MIIVDTYQCSFLSAGEVDKHSAADTTEVNFEFKGVHTPADLCLILNYYTGSSNHTLNLQGQNANLFCLWK